jgi:hypothetical protein
MLIILIAGTIYQGRGDSTVMKLIVRIHSLPISSLGIETLVNGRKSSSRISRGRKGRSTWAGIPTSVPHSFGVSVAVSTVTLDYWGRNANSDDRREGHLPQAQQASMLKVGFVLDR